MGYTRLGEARLKSGETLEIGVVAGPAPEWRDRLAEFLAHKGPDWLPHITRALEGPLDALQTRFYVGSLNGSLAAQIMIVGAVGVGILGHVFTRPEHRRKGACQAVMTRLMADMPAAGFRLLTLGTGFDSPPYWIYHGFGFRSMRPRSGQMVWEAEPGAGAPLFRPGPARVRPLEWGDWGAVAYLASQDVVPEEEGPRSLALDCPGVGYLEGPYIRFQLRRERTPESQAWALVNEEDRAVGWSSLMPDRSWGGRRLLLDAWAHPAFPEGVATLLDAVNWPDERVVAVVAPGARHKPEALRRHGFSPVARLPRWLPIATADDDVEVWARE
jgi:hypothetical protein